MITINNMYKKYIVGEQELIANNNINVTIEKGEFVAVLGPSGSGKSTLLNIIGGMDSPTSGEVIVDGVDIAKLNDKELTKYRAKQIGFVFQFYNLIPTLTVQENVSVVKELKKESSKSVDEIKLIEEVGLKMHCNKFPNMLSGGEQQRVSVARALAKSPKILLCDEPTGALDSDTGAKILSLLQKFSKEMDVTVIIVTHNQAIAQIADRVIKIKNGCIIGNEVVENPMEVSEVAW